MGCIFSVKESVRKTVTYSGDLMQFTLDCKAEIIKVYK
jgi:hypothetical protein